MLRVLHISDLHFGPPFLPHVGEALLRIAPTLKPEVIVASGDFTQRAKEEQFAEARDFLQKLPAVPIVLVPGNHDVPLYRLWDRLTEPHALYREYISQDLNTVTRLKDVVIVALDSSAPRRAITNGRIREEQLEFCEEALRDAPEHALRIVVAHHHLAPAPDYEREQVLPGAKRILERLVRMRVDVVMGGHLHRAYIGNSLDVYSGADRERGVIIVQCGTTTSRRGRVREREKNSFNMIELDREMVRVTHFMHFEDDREFGPISRHFFPRPGRRFVEPGSGNAPSMRTTEV